MYHISLHCLNYNIDTNDIMNIVSLQKKGILHIDLTPKVNPYTTICMSVHKDLLLQD